MDEAVTAALGDELVLGWALLRFSAVGKRGWAEAGDVLQGGRGRPTWHGSSPPSPAQVCGDSGDGTEHPSPLAPLQVGFRLGKLQRSPPASAGLGFCKNSSICRNSSVCRECSFSREQISLQTSCFLRITPARGNRVNLLQHDVLACPSSGRSSGSFDPGSPRVLSVTQRQ